MMRRAGMVVLVLVFLLEAMLYARLWEGLVADPGHRDFGRFYQATVAALAGEDLYGPTNATERRPGDGEYLDINPPHFHLLVLPFTVLPQPTALVAWQAVSFVALALSLILAARVIGWRRLPVSTWALLLAALLMVPGIQANFWLGQSAWIIAWFVTAAWAAAHAGWMKTAGAHLGIAVALKPFLAPLLVWHAGRRAWGATISALVSGAFCLVAGALVFGLESYRGWLGVVRRIDWEVVPFNASAYGWFSRACYPEHAMTFAPALDAPWLRFVGWALTALIVGVVTARALCTRAQNTDAAFAALLVTGLLLSPLGWVYYLVFLAGPLASLVARGTLRDSAGPREGLIAAVALVGLMWPPAALWLGHPAPLATLTFASAYFWGMLALWRWFTLQATRA